VPRVWPITASNIKTRYTIRYTVSMRHRPIKMLSINLRRWLTYRYFCYSRIWGSKDFIYPVLETVQLQVDNSATRSVGDIHEKHHEKGSGAGKGVGCRRIRVKVFARRESRQNHVKTGDLHAFSWQALHSPTNHLSLRVRRWLMLRSLTGQWTLHTLHDWTLNRLYDAMATNRWP